ncbi:MAG: hypothetical protein KDJ72_12415 [Methyloceanibacter sp.]|uniref:hypothetical protein n=1 Tax=Methyloceanibacter sp. TaxID=1965321 RepID=UPI001DC2D71A|nr:hypothetical protein [Methyloceanibacter sp.]MCB1443815.1 hypothetical protein [Methyloceanibacter sp.]MCC0058205.1 hypothetical protein [Hyphomicrobiaceae bacterium]
MKPASVILAFAMLALWQTAAFGGEWYVHRESRQTKEPPYYCYCYSRSKANVLAGKVTYPMDMQVSEAQAIAKQKAYAGLPDTCPNNCGAGPPGQDGNTARAPVPPKQGPAPAPECQKFAQVGGCSGFCNGMAAGYESTLGAEIKKCISDCLDKFHCKQ